MFAKNSLTTNFRSDLPISCYVPDDTCSNGALGHGCQLDIRKRACLMLRKDRSFCFSALIPHHGNDSCLPERTVKGNEMLAWSDITQEPIAECCSITIGTRKTFRITVFCLKKAMLISCLHDRQSGSRAPLLMLCTKDIKNTTPGKLWYYVKPIHINILYCIYPPWDE